MTGSVGRETTSEGTWHAPEVHSKWRTLWLLCYMVYKLLPHQDLIWPVFHRFGQLVYFLWHTKKGLKSELHSCVGKAIQRAEHGGEAARFCTYNLFFCKAIFLFNVEINQCLDVVNNMIHLKQNFELPETSVSLAFFSQQKTKPTVWKSLHGLIPAFGTSK